MNQLAPLLLLLFALGPCPPLSAADVNREYHFKLVKGAGTPVCDAYLARLNSIDYANDLPFCDRPESDAVAGFAKLNRASLTLADQNALMANLYNFTHVENPIPASRTNEMFSPFYGKMMATIWRYEPPIDIENNGHAANLIVWRGWGAESGTHQCGSGYGASGGFAWRSVQKAYILNADGTAVDETRTRNVFWRAVHSRAGLQPIGQSISIFEFAHQVYFDAFLYDPRCFDCMRSAPRFANTLGVFLHSNGKTKQICEFHMRDPETEGPLGILPDD